MVFFNYATMQMAAKIVYYGPGLCGKTTNLHHIYNKTTPQGRGEMVSLETETDRTLFFDLLPIDVGVIGGFRTRLQLYTVPGQVFYNTTRKLVLKGADGVVFVADSQPLMLDANIDSFRNLRQNLEEIGIGFEELPVVIQLNKRDLPNVLPCDEILAAIDPDARYQYQEASALKGEGVFDTLKMISKLTLRTLRKRMMGDDSITPPPTRQTFYVQSEPQIHPPVHEDVEPGRTVAIPAPVSPPFEERGGEEEPAAYPEQTRTAVDLAEAPSEVEAGRDPRMAPRSEAEPAPVDAISAQAPVTPVAPPEEESEEKEPGQPPASEPEMKRVKVRSSVDIMAELEALRKRATQGTRTKKEEPDAVAPAKREIYRTLDLEIPADAAAQARRLKLVLEFEDAEGSSVSRQQRELDLESLVEIQRLMLNLRVHFDSESND